MGLGQKWIDWIMLYVTVVNYSICFNDSEVGPVSPRRGLCQGDRISPYLFLFFVEGLSQVIKDDDVHGCNIATNALEITHPLFANDSFLFFRASHEEVVHIKNIF